MTAAWLSPRRVCFSPAALLALVMLAIDLQADEPKSSIRITKLDGSYESASEVTFDADRRTLTIAELTLSLDDIRRIQFQRASATDSKTERPNAEIHLRDGSLLFAESASISKDTCRFSFSKSQELKLDLDQLAALKLGPVKLGAAKFEAEVARPDRQHDRLFIANADAVTVLDGFLEELQDGTVRFEWMNETRKLAADRLRAVVFASGPSGDLKPERFSVQLQNGSRLSVSSFATSKIGADGDDATARVTTRAGVTLELPTSTFARIESRSSRLKYLSDMQPETASATTITALPRSWRRGRSVTGRVLSSGTDSFERGLGIPAGTRLSFRVPERAESFVVTVSLDQRPNPSGDCACVVSVDGREVVRERLTSSDSSRLIRVPCRSAGLLEVRVEPGMNLDFGDFTNWCDASFVLSTM